MLMEWAHYLTTPAPLSLRRLGHVRETVSLLSRSRRCRAAWADHLASARAAVSEAASGLARRRTAVVLGSGLLDDVPLAALASDFHSVILVDAVHPWPTRRAARAHRNVALVTADLSGAADWLLGEAADLADRIPDLCRAPEVDLVISANLLSQLPILPLDWLAERGRPADGLGRRIVEAHLSGLAGLSARICLVTDLEEIEEDRQGRVTERIDLLHGVDLPPTDRAWTWQLAPFGEAARHHRLLHTVRAYPDWGRSAAGR